jgi:hypothetical protein
MNATARTVIVLALLAVFVLPGQAVHAKGVLDGRVVFGDDFTLESGESLDGDLVVFGGDVTIEAGATVHGSVVVFGGTISQDGTVEQDIVILGGQIELGEAALVEGDVVSIGGQVDRAAGAVVEGEVIENMTAPTLNIPGPDVSPRVGSQPDFTDIPGVRAASGPLARSANAVFQAVAMAALAMLLALFLNPQIERVGKAILDQPAVSGSVGLLTVVLLPLALVIMVITIILIPVAVLGVMAVMLAWIFGMIAMGNELGERMSKSASQPWGPVITAGLGTLVLMLVAGFAGMVPCFGPLVRLVLGLMAIGGVVMALFGVRRARPVDPTEPAIPPP